MGIFRNWLRIRYLLLCAFRLLGKDKRGTGETDQRCRQNTAEYRAGVLRIAQKLEDWNAANMGSIELDPLAQAFIKTMEEGK